MLEIDNIRSVQIGGEQFPTPYWPDISPALAKALIEHAGESVSVEGAAGVHDGVVTREDGRVSLNVRMNPPLERVNITISR